MSKRKTMDKAQARERRNRLLESAAAAELSLTEGVREMRAIAGMTQEDFARHREVSGRVIKAIELGQANPTVATLNRIGQFFGLEVGFVPVKRAPAADGLPRQAGVSTEPAGRPAMNRTAMGPYVGHTVVTEGYRELAHLIALELIHNSVDAAVVKNAWTDTLDALDKPLTQDESQNPVQDAVASPLPNDPAPESRPGESTTATTPARKKRKPRSS